MYYPKHNSSHHSYCSAYYNTSKFFIHTSQNYVNLLLALGVSLYFSKNVRSGSKNKVCFILIIKLSLDNDIHNKNTYVPFAFTSMQRICRASYPRNYTTCQFRASISSCLKLNLSYHKIVINMHSFLIAKILSIYDQEICTFDPVSFLTPKSSSNS